MSLHDSLFLIPLGFGVLLVLLLSLGLVHLEGDFDAHHAALELHHAELEHGFLESLGVGRVPLMVILLLLSLSFGGVGLVLQPWLSGLFGPARGLLASALAAGVTSLVVTRASARTLARLIPSVESYASHKREILGQVGTVVVVLSPEDVLLRVRDEGGGELRVRADVLRETRVSQGSQLVLTGYDEARDRYRAELAVD